MSTADKIIIALLIAILARTYRPPLGEDSTSNTVAIALTQFAVFAYIGWTLA